jgi:hypothetical protein
VNPCFTHKTRQTEVLFAIRRSASYKLPTKAERASLCSGSSLGKRDVSDFEDGFQMPEADRLIKSNGTEVMNGDF